MIWVIECLWLVYFSDYVLIFVALVMLVCLIGLNCFLDCFNVDYIV